MPGSPHSDRSVPTGSAGATTSAAGDLARFLYEHEAGGDSDGPWTDRRRDFYLAFASDILAFVGERVAYEGHYRGLDWDNPERSGTFCGNCMEPWPCPSMLATLVRTV